MAASALQPANGDRMFGVEIACTYCDSYEQRCNVGHTKSILPNQRRVRPARGAWSQRTATDVVQSKRTFETRRKLKMMVSRGSRRARRVLTGDRSPREDIKDLPKPDEGGTASEDEPLT